MPDVDDDLFDPPAAPKLRKVVRGAEKLKGVQPDLINHWNNLQMEFDKAGIIPTVKSGYRTAEQQNSLHRRGFPTKGNDGYINISPHQEGRALDLGFNGAQKAKGREIVSAYAKQHGLYTPPDEPWHIALPKAQKAQVVDDDLFDSDDDLFDAPAAPQVKRAQLNAIRNAVAQAMNVTEQAAQRSVGPARLPVNPSKIEVRPRPFTFNAKSDEQVKADIRSQVAREQAETTLPGRAPNIVGRELDAEVEDRFKQFQQAQAADAQYARTGPSMQARNNRIERAKAAISPYTPGLASLDTPMGIKTDLPRGIASLGIADLSRQISPEEQALDPEAQSKANLAYGVGSVAPAVIPYVGAGKLAARAIPGATRAAATGRMAATMGGVATAREAARTAQTGEAPSLSNIAIETAIGSAMGGIAGLNPSLKRQVVAFVAPGVAAGVARGEKLPEIAQSAVTNLLFGLHSGATPKELTAKRIGELRRKLTSDGVPEKPETLTAQLDQRGYTLVPEGTQRPSLPRGTRAEKTADGVVYYDPTRIDAATIRNTPTSELLGHVEPKSETTTEAVVARAPDGTEIQSSAVSPENVAKQAEVTQANFPEARVETGGPELAESVIADRVEPQRYQHLQFGEVEALADQSGAGNGRVKVAEVGDPTKIHYVKKADLQGRGNSRMIPVKPAETSPETIAANVQQQTEVPPSTLAPSQPEGFISRDMATRLTQLGYTPEQQAAMSTVEKARLIAAENRRGTGRVDQAEWEAMSPEMKSAVKMLRPGGDMAETAPEIPPTPVEKGGPTPATEGSAVGAPEMVRPTEPSTKPVPEFVRAARERMARTTAQAAETIGTKGAKKGEAGATGITPQEVLDTIIVRGYELYTEKVKPTFQEWSKKLKEEFGPKANEHLDDVWAKLGGEPEDRTSAAKASMAADRAELDLPDLPAAERKSWQTSLDNARDRLLPERAVATAKSVLEKPRALDDEDTAGLVLKAQEIKNSHRQAMEDIAAENDVDKLRDLRAHTEGLQDDFDTITDALKQSGTEKGRALAIQKLTINQDYDLVSLMNRYKLKTGKKATGKEKETIERQASIIKDLQERLDAHEERVRNDQVSRAAAKIRREVARETRTAQRGIKKGDLDAEATQLKQLIAAAWKKQSTRKDIAGMAAIDPEAELAKLVLKLARNRLKANLGLPAAELLDEVHGLLQDVTDLDRRRIAEIISGYGRKTERQSELQQQMNALKTELRQGLAAEDIAAGKRTAKTQGPPKPPKLGPRESWPARKAAIEKQIAELERRTTEGDFSKRRAQGKTVYDDPESKRLMEDLGRAKLNYERKLRQWEDQNRSMPEKVADLAIKWGRAAKLSYTSTLGKLGSAAAGRTVMSPIENLLGEIPHRLFPKLSAKATTEGGGFSKSAEVAALWKSGRLRQVLNQLRSGASDLDLLYGPHSKMLDKEMSGEGVLGIPGRVHGALKEYPRQAEFNRAFLKTLKSYEKEGRDVTEPSVQLVARMEAFNAAERARFQQHNAISDTFNSAMGALERKGILGKGLAKTGKFLFPIVRVPVNVAGETLNYSFGVPRAALETAIRGGVKNLTPEQANNIMRAYKKGGVGLAMMAYAFLHPEQFGGYYQEHDKRKPNEPKAGEMMVFGYRIPKALTHVPILEAGQLAATARRVYDKLTTKGESKGEALLGGASAGIKGVAEGVPFYETPARYFTGKEGTKGTAQYAGEQVKGMIPGFVQEYAKARDVGPSGTPAVRRPQGSFAERFGQTIKSGIPIARETVPISAVFGNKVTKASDEVQRLNIPMVGAVRQPDESEADFKKREAVQNGNIRTQLENVVALPEYDKETDDNKTKWLKQAAAFATDRTREQLPEKPDKKEEKQFPMPQSKGTGFESTYPADALSRFERMSAAERAKVYSTMQRKGLVLLNDPRLSSEQKAEFKKRLDALGITTTRSRTMREQFASP